MSYQQTFHSYNQSVKPYRRAKSGSIIRYDKGNFQDEISSLIKPPLPISYEYDQFCEQHHGDLGIYRSDWLQKIFEKHPDLQRLRECVNPIARSASFARLYLPSNRMIPHELLLAFISQHLRTLGLCESQASLHSEWGSDFNIPPHKMYSQLAFLAQRGIHRAERFWELSMPSIHSFDKIKLTQSALDEEISRAIGAAPNTMEDNTKLTDETPEDPRFVKFDNDHTKFCQGEPTQASLNQLIYYITSSEQNVNSSELTSALLLTISSYASSRLFFSKLKERFLQIKESNIASLDKLSNEDHDVDKKKTALLRCVKVIKEWIKGSIDDIEPQVLDDIKKFVDKEIMPLYPKLCQKMFEVKTDSKMIRIKQLEEKAPPIEIGRIKGFWTGEFELFELPPIEFARQLTVWSSTRYYSIQRCELLDCSWDNPRLKYRAPNVIALTIHYNRLTNWICYQILSEKSLSKRIWKMERLIEIGHLLFEMKNYHDGSAVILAFDSPDINRLKVHMKLLSQSSQDYLSQLIPAYSPSNNFAQLRSLQQKALNSGKPVIPLLPILLKDIFLYTTSTQAFIDGLINIKRCKGVCKCIKDLEVFMREKFCFLPIDQVQTKLEEFQEYDIELLSEMSYDIEPENAETQADLKDIKNE